MGEFLLKTLPRGLTLLITGILGITLGIDFFIVGILIFILIQLWDINDKLVKE